MASKIGLGVIASSDEPKAGSACGCAEDDSESPNVISRMISFCCVHIFDCDCKVVRMYRSYKMSTSRDKWLKSYGLLVASDMPDCLRESYLNVGYRPNPSSFTYCLKSMLYPTNETMNFWTHFIAFFLLLYRFYVIFIESLSGTVTDPLYYPLLVYAACACLMLFGSSLAHLFSCLSINARETCWFCDYGCVTLSGLGSILVFHFYVCPFSCMGIPVPYYLMNMAISAMLAHAIACYSRQMSSKIKYVLRSAVFGIMYIVSSVPCTYMFVKYSLEPILPAHAEYLTMGEDVQCHVGKASFIVMFTLVTLCTYATPLFNITKFPEKYYPGTFDIVGHSHQWFHISIALAFYFQTYLVESVLMEVEQLHEHRDNVVSKLNITWWETVGLTSVVALSCLIVICYFTRKNYCKQKVE